MNKETKVFVCNPHADISDYKALALSDKEIEALLQKGKTGEGKNTVTSFKITYNRHKMD